LWRGVALCAPALNLEASDGLALSCRARHSPRPMGRGTPAPSGPFGLRLCAARRRPPSESRRTDQRGSAYQGFSLRAAAKPGRPAWIFGLVVGAPAALKFRCPHPRQPGHAKK
jgi:hypothetical protein